MFFNKSRAEEVPGIGTKTFTYLKAYLMQSNYTLYALLHHIRDEHYQSKCTWNNTELPFK